MVGYDLVIFDCDGVLVDSEVLACRSLAETLVRHGVACSLEDVFDRFLGRSFAVVEDHYKKVRGQAPTQAFRADLRDRQLALFRSSLKTMPHAREVLDTLDRPFCLASSSDAERIRMTLGVTGLDSYFGDRVYTAAMVKKGKPAPDLFLYAADKMGAPPERTLVVEDSVSGVEAGKAAGMTVWAFTGGSHYAGRRDIDAALVAAGADRVFAAMADFMAPAALAPEGLAR
jgi:HAD superfamily hydrolase (TIGR01509 family)